MGDKLLIVDDEKNILSSFQRSLGGKYSLITASSSEEALIAIKEKGPFALVISDYKMPGMDGIELLAQIRILAPYMVRIMLTGYLHEKVAIDAVNRGLVFQFLTKPCSSKGLEKTIETGLRYHQLLVKEENLFRRRSHRIPVQDMIGNDPLFWGSQKEKKVAVKVLSPLYDHLEEGSLNCPPSMEGSLPSRKNCQRDGAR